MSRSWRLVAHPQQVTVGPGQLDRLRPLLKATGAQRLLVVASSRALSSAAGQALVAGAGRMVAGTFDDVGHNVPAGSVQALGRRVLSEGADGLVALGGGSTIDLAKAVTFFVEQQQGTPGVSFTDQPTLVHVAVPTTFVGAMASPHFAMTDGSARAAHVAEAPTLVPRFVVVDPLAIEDMPAEVTARTGLVALSHAIDAALAPGRSPESEALARAAFGRLYGALAPAVEGEADAVGALQEASVLAARAWQPTTPGLAHALAQLVAARTGAPYAAVSARLIGPVMRFNADVGASLLEQLARSVMVGDLPTAIDELTAEVGVTASLSDLGVADDDVAAVARIAQSNPFVQHGVRPAAEADIAALLETIW